MAWIIMDVIPFLLPPSILLLILGWPYSAAAWWLLTVSVIAVTYPATLQGPELLRYYASVYLVTYAIIIGTMIYTGLRRGYFEREELALLFLATSGIGSVYSGLHCGLTWWALWITNGPAYVAISVLALKERRG